MATEEQIVLKELTKAQIAKFGLYRDNYIKYGLCTEPANRPAAEDCIIRAYANAVPKPLPPPKKFYWVDSPLAGAKLAQKLLKEAGTSTPGVDSVLECGFGQHDASWLAFYSFFAKECNLKSAKPVLPLAELCEHGGWWWPFDEVCICAERPKVLSLNKRGLLHNEKGPAIQYRDTFQVFALNGVCLSESIVMTDAKELDPKLVLTESNAEVRREILRKVGIERFIQVIDPKIISKEGNYELLEISPEVVKGWPQQMPKMVYLKMINPSIATYHVEAVDPTCDTVQKAINWRATQMQLAKDENWEPSALT